MYLNELQDMCDQLNKKRWNVTYEGLNYDYLDKLCVELRKNYAKTMGSSTYKFDDCIERLEKKKKEIDEAINDIDYSSIYLDTKVVDGSTLRKKNG